MVTILNTTAVLSPWVWGREPPQVCVSGALARCANSIPSAHRYECPMLSARVRLFEPLMVTFLPWMEILTCRGDASGALRGVFPCPSRVTLLLSPEAPGTRPPGCPGRGREEAFVT